MPSALRADDIIKDMFANVRHIPKTSVRSPALQIFARLREENQPVCKTASDEPFDDYIPFGEEIQASWHTAGYGYVADSVRQKFNPKKDGELSDKSNLLRGKLGAEAS